MPISFDRVADIYDETRRVPREVLSGIVTNVAGEVDPADGPLLDLGIGTGRIALPLVEAGFHVVGVDLSEKMLARLRENQGERSDAIHAVRGDVTALPFEAGLFSAAVAVHVFHLLDDMEAAIKEARRVLAPGGCLLFCGEQRLIRYVQRALHENYGVTEDLVRMLARAGVKLPDQAEVERRVAACVRDVGGDFRQLPPVEWEFDITVDDIIGRIKNRAGSYLWAVSEDDISALARRLRSAMAARHGPPLTKVGFRRRFDMFCARF